MAKLEQFNAAARKKLEAQNTKSLDDFPIPRSQMATASEIGGCARKAALNALCPPTHNDDRKLMWAERGHIFEMIQEGYLQAMGFKKVSPEEFSTAPGTCYVGGQPCHEGAKKQYGIMHPHLPIGCHIDFVVKHKDGSLFVIECKTTDGIPDEPYGNWVEQLHVQLGLLALQFPGVEIRGSVLARDLNKGKEREFPGYTPNEQVFEYLCEKGIHIALAKKGAVTEPDTCPGPLCSFCDHQKGCPAFTAGQDLPDELVEVTKELVYLGRHSKANKEEQDRVKSIILSITGERNYRGKKDGVLLNVVKFNDTEIVDGQKLKAEYPDIYDQVKKPKSGYIKVEARILPPATSAEIQAAA